MVKFIPETQQRIPIAKHSGDTEFFSDLGEGAVDNESVPIIGPWTDKHLGGMDSSIRTYRVTGNISLESGTPTAIGNYVESGTYNNQTAYVKEDGKYWIWYSDPLEETWYISLNKGQVRENPDDPLSLNLYWKQQTAEMTGSNYVGNELAQGTAVLSLFISGTGTTTRQQLMWAGITNKFQGTTAGFQGARQGNLNEVGENADIVRRRNRILSR